MLRKPLRFLDCDRLRFGDSRGEGSESPELERADATRRDALVSKQSRRRGRAAPCSYMDDDAEDPLAAW